MTTVIVPSTGGQSINFGELWRFRELLYFLIWRDVKVRYKQTVLGVVWALLQPALMMVVFTIFLGRLAKVPAASDPVFVYAGILPWTFFATTVTNAGSSLINSERLITKVYFPRLAVPLSAVGAGIIDFVIALTLLVALMAWRGIQPGLGILLAPVAFALITLAAIGVGTLLAALTAAYRDFKYLIPFLVQFWLFATPAAYSRMPEDTPLWMQAVLAINPMSGLIATFRAAIFNEPIPWNLLAIAAGVVIVLVAVGCKYFRRVEDTLTDIL